MSNKTNENEEDFLEVDQPIPGQNFVCMSFLSPEKTLVQKQFYFLKHFLVDLINDDKKRNYLLNMTTEKITYKKVEDMFEDFMVTNDKKVSDLYDTEVDFKTNVRGIKVRGVYDTRREAEVRAKVLQRRDPNFNVFVGSVGYWLPWDPTNMDKIDQEYNEKQLNELMKNYRENAEQRDMFYEEEKRSRIEKAREETRLKKEQQLKEGIIKTIEVPTGEKSLDKIDEFREIIKEKDDKFMEIESANKANKNLEKMKATQTQDDPLGNKSGYSDPWMKRKVVNEETFDTPTDSNNVITHNATDVTDVTESKNINLDKIVKNIF